MLAHRLQAAARFLVGLVGGVACSSTAAALLWTGDRTLSIGAALAGWTAGWLAYRSTRSTDLFCSKGVGIGTLLGQIVFIALYNLSLGNFRITNIF